MTPEEFLRVYPVDVILKKLGMDNLTESSDYWRFSSPFRTDKNPSMVCYKSKAYCIDFGGTFKGSIFSLSKEITGQSLYKLFNESYSNPTKERLSWGSTPVRSQSREEAPERVFDEVMVKGTFHDQKPSHGPVEDECVKRGISEEFWKEFNLSWTSYCVLNGMAVYDRLLIPIVESGKTISIEARDLTGKSSKKVLYPPRGSVSTLFNLDNLDKEKPLIVVEGVMDIPKIWGGVTRNVTTTFGIQITNRQKILLRDFKEIILFPDGDEGGSKFIENLDEALPGKEFKVAIFPGKDPGDLPVSQIKKAIDDAISVTEYYANESGLFENRRKSWQMMLF